MVRKVPASASAGASGSFPPFLAGGGDLGELMRNRDWTKTSLGPPETWPKSLKTAVRIMLTSQQAIWVGWGRDLVYLYNDPYKPIIGGKHPAALGQPTQAVWREIWEFMEPLMRRAMVDNEGSYFESQLLIMERNGYPEETYYTFSFSPIPDDDGVTTGGIICANTDDTKRVIGERQLALLRELATRTGHARTSAEACLTAGEALATDARDLPFALIYLTEPGQPGFTLAATSGVPASHPLRQFDPAPWALDAVLAGRQLVATDLAALGDLKLPTGAWDVPARQLAFVPLPASGSTSRSGVLVVGLNPFRLLDEGYRNFLNLIGGQIAASLASAQAYAEEKRRAEALAELDRAKTEFFSNVSHEFRTPLTLILGPVEDLLDQPAGELPDAARSQLRAVHRNSLRLLKLVNTMLDFSRLEAGRVEASYVPVDLARYTADLASVFRAAIERAGLKLRVNCAPLSEPVYVDRDMWEKIVLNLLSNAFKFTLQGEIEVRLEQAGHEARLTFRDTGVGIPPDQVEKVFERFHRVRESRGRTHEGTGIGLALVQELVRLHGGSIRAESAVDQGSRFIVTLPLGRAHLDPARVRPEPGAARPPGAGHGAAAFAQEALRWTPDGIIPPAPGRDSLPPMDHPAAADGPRPHVLWADDNADMRDYVTRLLLPQFEVTAVNDGQAALDAARARPPDLVLSDVMMPRLDGFGLLKALRADPTLATIPIILLSARAGEEARVEGVAAGADDYLIKPFSARELLARVDAHIRIRRLRLAADSAVRESEERFRALATASSYVLYRMTPDWAEMAALDGRGFLSDTIKPSRTWLGDYILPEDQSRVSATIRHAIDTRGIFELEHRVRLADGSVGWTHSRAVPLFDAQGRIREWFGAATDVTVRKRAEEALRQRTAQFETLLDRAPLGVYVVDADFRLRDINPMALPVFAGIPNLHGRNFEEVVRLLWPKHYADEVVRLFRHTLATGESYSTPELSEVRQDRKATEYYEWRIDRIPLPDGRPGVVCYFREISAQVRTRLAIAASEERYRTLVSVTTDVPWTADEGGAFITPQPAWEAYTGQTWEDHRGFGWTNALHPEDRDRLLADWQLARARRMRYLSQGRFWHAAGREWRHFELQAAPLLYADGNVREWVGSCTDCENRMRAEQQLKQARDAALAANRAKDEFLATLSHELRTPLNPVLLVASESAQDPALPEPVRGEFRMIADNVALQARLVDDLLDLNRLTRGKMNLELRPVDVHGIVRDAAATISEDIAARSLTLTFDLRATTPVINGDPVRLRQVFWNVMKNGVKFTPEGGRLEVASADLPGDREFEVRFRDSGIGMQPDELARVFDPFVQGHHADEGHGPAYGGLGLGLAISRMLIERQGGTIRAESPGTGQGSTITVRFARNPLATAADLPRPGGTAAEAAPAARPGAGRRVLFVEDHAPTRTALAGLLKRRGYEVLVAGSIGDALRLATENRFEVLISDLGLPDGDGTSLMAELRRQRPKLPGVAISGYGMAEDLARSHAAGFGEHLTKPVSFDLLERALARLLETVPVR